MVDEATIAAPTIPVLAVVVPTSTAPTDMQYMPRRGTFDLRGAKLHAGYLWTDGKFYEDDMTFQNTSTLHTPSGLLAGWTYKSRMQNFYTFFGSEVIARTSDFNLDIYAMFYSFDGHSYHPWPTSYGALRHPLAPLAPTTPTPTPPSSPPPKPDYESLQLFLSTSRSTVIGSFAPPNFPDRTDSAVLSGTITAGQVTFRSLIAGVGLFVAIPGGAASGSFASTLDEPVLTSTGEQNIDIMIPGQMTAVGLSFYATGHGPVTLTAYGATDAVLESVNVQPDGVARKGFVGFQASQPIARINWHAVDGRGTLGGISEVWAGTSWMPQGIYRREWMRLGGPYGPMGYPNPTEPPQAGVVGIISFQNGGIATNHAVWENGVLGAYQRYKALAVDWMVSWDGPPAFQYDQFTVKISAGGRVVFENPFTRDQTQLSDRGHQEISMGDQPDGDYDVTLEVDNPDPAPSLTTAVTGRGTIGPIRVHYAVNAIDHDKYAALDLTEVPVATLVPLSQDYFEQRTARAVLCNACQVLPPSGFDQVGDFGLIALAKLAYPDYFPSSRLPGRDYPVRDEVFAMLRLQNANGRNVGTSQDSPPLKRSGDYDPELAAILAILFKYDSVLPGDVRDHLISEMLTVSGPMNDDDHWPFSAPFPVKHLDITESENHILLIESARYLTNLLLFRRDQKPEHNNLTNGLSVWWMGILSGFLRYDFVEYNARPYQDYAMYALLNLASYAEEPVKTGAVMVLDYLMAKVAVSSNDSRRSTPFRRRNEDQKKTYDLRVFDSDPQTAFSLALVGSSGMAKTAPFGAPMATEVQWAGLSTYRVPELILDLMIDPTHRVFTQHFNHATTETYVGSMSYLIAAGGRFAAAAYTVDSAAMIRDLATIVGLGAFTAGLGHYPPGSPLFFAAAFLTALGPAVTLPDEDGLVHKFGPEYRAMHGQIFTTVDIGLARPTVLIPSGQYTSLADMVHFRGVNDDFSRVNMGVTLDFACGINPFIPLGYAPAATAIDDHGQVVGQHVDIRPWVFIDQSTPALRQGTFSDQTFGYYLAVYRFDPAMLPRNSPIHVVDRGSDHIDILALGRHGAVWDTWFDGTWHEWERRGVATFAPETRIAIDSRNTNQIDLFTVGLDNGVWNASFDGAWHEWKRLGTAVFAQGSTISTVHRGGDHLDLFILGLDGGVWNAWFDGGWHEWERRGTAVFAPGTPITVTSRDTNQIDLFMLGLDGGVWNAWFDGDWHEWERRGALTFPVNTPIAVDYRSTNQMDLFAVGGDGKVWNSWFNNDGWHEWEQRGTQTFPEKSSIGLVHRGSDHLDLFVLGSEGGLWNSWFDGTWHDWKQRGTKTFPANTPIAVISRDTNQIDLFMLGLNCGVWNASFDGDWHDWEQRGAMTFAADTTITVNYRNNNQMDLFVVGDDGGVWNSWFNNDGWHEWARITNEYGFLEAYDTMKHSYDGGHVLSFDEFRDHVLANNNHEYTPTGINTYVMSDGRQVHFAMAPESFVVQPDSASSFLQGDVMTSAKGTGVVTITNPFLKKQLTLNITDPMNPLRTFSDLA